ncbi:hypothetical protein LPJ66_003989 [Kickxella alabastrina]|uniref:Uncharacterized protein n=1 Tax=Kickxella alabastrina TaxID=61397 RepID=A0ACC1INB9_9FUNG|nr:hypothetical protein LPJ66_003989 [Kickxella alabastrina]
MLQLIVAQAQGSSAAEGGRLRTVVLLQVLVMTPQRVGRVSANGLPQGGSKQRQRSDTVLVSVCAAMVKQFALRTEYHQQIIDLAFLPALLGVARQSVSELGLLRMLMERLVWLCTFLMAYWLAAAEENATEVVNPQMVQLLELGAVDVITACVRQDDQGVSSWGIGFLHEFVSRSVGNETTIFKCVNVFSSNYN